MDDCVSCGANCLEVGCKEIDLFCNLCESDLCADCDEYTNNC